MALVVNRAREQGSRAGPHHTSCASLPVLEYIVSLRGRIEDPSHQDREGRGHMSLNPISSQSLTVFIYLRPTLLARIRGSRRS